MTPRLPALLAATVALAASAPSLAQQRLFALGSDGTLSEVVGFATTAGSLVPLASVPLPPGTLARGLAADPATGDLFVLTLAGTTASVLRVDPGSGQVTPVCSLAAPLADGLDARFDGWLVLQQTLDTLVLLHPTTCMTTLVPTAQPIGIHTSDGSVAFDRRGLVVALGADGTAQRIDPLDGTSSPFGAAVFSGSHSIEVDGNEVYYGQFDGSLFASGAQLRQVLGGTGVSFAGLAFAEPADGAGMSIACAGQPNSTGGPATVEALGTAVVGEGDLELRCRTLPPNSFGYFLTGPNQGSVPVGSGVLCIAAPQQRYSLLDQNAGSSGTVRFSIDLAALPDGTPVLVGDTYLFQYWHRDSGATSNLSPALRVDFR
ncbi:MAG: hypothetical protein AAGB93_18945 [Planctomycetota bacterium]